MAAYLGCQSGKDSATVSSGLSRACEVTNPCQISATRTPGGSCLIKVAADGTACDQGNPCVSGQTCTAGQCGSGQVAAEGTACDDGNPCTQNTVCKSSHCLGEAVADGAACDDDSVCTENTVCQGGICQGGQAMACPAKGPCYVDGACDPKAGCQDVPITGPCRPGLPFLPLVGCCSADYSAPIMLGDDTYQLIVDSGSATAAVAGASCSSGCEGLSPLYTPSAHGANTGIKTESYYGDQSGWSGSIYQDTVTLPGLALTSSFNFAAMSWASSSSRTTTPFFVDDYCTGDARTNTRQGILGLANSEIVTSRKTDAIVEVLAKLGAKDYQNAFATQLCNLEGRLWFGGFDPAYMAGAPVYTPFDDSDGFYRVEVDDIMLGGKSLGLSSAFFADGAVVDNGTSNMQVPNQVFEIFAARLSADANFTRLFKMDMLDPGGCRSPTDQTVTRAQLDAMLPSFTWVLAPMPGQPSVHVTMPATASYLTMASNPYGGDFYCGTFLSSQSDGSSSSSDLPTIIGNAAMRAHVVIFDRANKQLGFAPQRNCQGGGL